MRSGLIEALDQWMTLPAKVRFTNSVRKSYQEFTSLMMDGTDNARKATKNMLRLFYPTRSLQNCDPR